MTYPEDMLDGLDATPEERLAFLRALDEAEAEEDAGYGGGYDDGPWDDQAGLDRLAAAGDQVAARHASEADRVVADITDQLARPAVQRADPRPQLAADRGRRLPERPVFPPR